MRKQTGIAEFFEECKNAKQADEVKKLLSEYKNDLTLQKIIWMAYGGGRDNLIVPEGRPPSSVLEENWGDKSLEYTLNDMGVFLRGKNEEITSDRKRKIEAVWIKNLRMLTIEDCNILCAATLGDLTEWNLDQHIVREVFGEATIKSKKVDTGIEIVKKAKGRPPKPLGE